MERIAKVMARAGLCSRREAERWIEDGRVEINGTKITSAALNVSANDKIIVDGKPLPSADKTRLWMFHKPTGTVTTNNDPEGRQTVFDLLPQDMPRVVTVGRLDMNTEGLLLLTNDGELARKFELPANKWERTYRVRVYGGVDEKKLKSLENGVTIDGINYEPIKIEMENSGKGKNQWLRFTLTEGKNREIRKICEYIDLQVSRLIRISFGPFELGSLPPEKTEEIPINQHDIG